MLYLFLVACFGVAVLGQILPGSIGLWIFWASFHSVSSCWGWKARTAKISDLFSRPFLPCTSVLVWAVHHPYSRYLKSRFRLIVKTWTLRVLENNSRICYISDFCQMFTKRKGGTSGFIFQFSFRQKSFSWPRKEAAELSQQREVPVARNVFHFVPEKYAKFTGELARWFIYIIWRE